MSWHRQYSSMAAFENDDPSNASPTTGTDCDAELAEQIAVARTAVAGLVASGAIGGEGKDYSIALYGHANPGHAPRAIYANDCITVTVAQKSPTQVPTVMPGEPANGVGDVAADVPTSER